MLWGMREHAEDRLLRRAQVEERTGLARSTIYRWMRRGEFPEPVRLGRSAVRWRESTITRWLDAQPDATGRTPADAAR